MAEALRHEPTLGELAADALDRWAADTLDARAIDAAHRIPTEVISRLADDGYFGLSIPEAWGGAGLDLTGVCAAVEALARHDRSVATTLGLHLGLGTRGLIAFASDAVRADFLPDMAAGTAIGAFAATEPSAGSDLNALRTRGELDGDDLVLHGEKVYVTNGGLADVFTVLAATPGLGGRRAQTLAVVRRGDPGVSVGAEEDKLGLRGSSTTSLYLDGARGRIVGEAGKGSSHLQHILAWGRTAMAAGCIGTATAALEATAQHVQHRVQFGKPLGDLPVVRHQLADAAAIRFAMRAIVAFAGMDDDLEHASLAAKVTCSDGAWEIVDTCVQLHGGAGFIEETGLPLLLRDARITRIFEGANDVLFLRLGTREALAPLPRPSVASPQADDLARIVADRRAALVAAHGVRLIRRHTLLHPLGRQVALRLTSDAVALRAAALGTAEAHVLAARWLDLAARRCVDLCAEPPEESSANAIYDAMLSGGLP